MLLPAWTETAWFQELCMARGQIHFIRGKVAFIGPSARGIAGFPSVVALFGTDRATAEKAFSAVSEARPIRTRNGITRNRRIIKVSSKSR